jgi:hypothetical protein
MIAQTAKRELQLLEQAKSGTSQEMTAAHAPFATTRASLHDKQLEKSSTQQSQQQSKHAPPAAAEAEAVAAVRAEPQSAAAVEAAEALLLVRGRDAVDSAVVQPTAGASAATVDHAVATTDTGLAATEDTANTAAAAAADQPAVSDDDTAVADSASNVLHMVLQQLDVASIKRQCVLLLGCSDSTLATSLAEAGKQHCIVYYLLSSTTILPAKRAVAAFSDSKRIHICICV